MTLDVGGDLRWDFPITRTYPSEDLSHDFDVGALAENSKNVLRIFGGQSDAAGVVACDAVFDGMNTEASAESNPVGTVAVLRR